MASSCLCCAEYEIFNENEYQIRNWRPRLLLTPFLSPHLNADNILPEDEDEENNNSILCNIWNMVIGCFKRR